MMVYDFDSDWLAGRNSLVNRMMSVEGGNCHWCRNEKGAT